MDMPSFKEMMHLAKNDPETLERIRITLIEETIAAAPEHFHRRLRGLQFQIDMERRRSSNPMGACLNISKMMHDSLHSMRQTLNAAIGEPSDDFDSPSEGSNQAQILSFPVQATS